MVIQSLLTELGRQIASGNLSFKTGDDTPKPAPGRDEYQSLLDGGFSVDEAETWKAETTGTLEAGGFTSREIDDYFGVRDQNVPTQVDAAVLENMRNNWLEDATPADPNNPLEMLEAGWDMSAIGLMMGKPDVVAPENAGTLNTILQGAGMLAGDAIPAVAGAIGGFVAGGAVGGAAGAPSGPGAAVTATGGAIIGSGIGGAALPEAMRQVLVDSYQNEEFVSFEDFYTRAWNIMWNTTKAGAVGGLTAPLGGLAAKPVLSATGSVMAATAVNGFTQAVAGTAMFGAVEGQMPDMDDFVAASALALGVNVAGHWIGGRYELNEKGKATQDGLMRIYAETGVAPWEAVELAKTDKVLAQSIGAKDPSGAPATGAFRDHAKTEPMPFGLRGSTAKAETGAEGKGGEAFTNAPKIRAEHDLEVREIETQAMQRAFSAKLSPDQMLSVAARLEGSFNFAKSKGISEHDVVSHAGAIGRYQIMPGTGAKWGFSKQDLFDPVKNREAAKKELNWLATKFRHSDGSVDMEAVLIGYNAGPGRSIKFRANGRDYSKLPVETQKYLERARKMGALDGNPMSVDQGSIYGIKPVNPVDLTMRQFLDGANGKIVSRILPSGEIVPDVDAVASYLHRFGQEAGFKFLVGPGEESAAVGSRQGAPHYNETVLRGKGPGPRYDRVYMPDTPEDQARRWYGLGRAEILHHEVGHALHGKVLDKVDLTIIEFSEGNQTMRAEMEAASKKFRPKFWGDEGVGDISAEGINAYVLTPEELFADTVATFMTDPTSHMRMPEFVKRFGKKLAPYKFFIDRNMPRRKEGGGEWEPPPGDGRGGGAEGPQPQQDVAAGGAGGKPPAPPKGKAVGPAGEPPKKDVPSFPLTEDMLKAKIQDMISVPDDPGILDKGRSLVRSIMSKYVSELDPFRRFDLMREGKLTPDQVGLEDMFRSTYASKDRAGMMIHDGAFDAITFAKKSDVSVEAAFKMARKAGGDEYGFVSYLMAQRVLEKAAQGIDAVAKKGEDNPYFTLDEAQQYVDKAKKKYDEAAGVLRDSQHWLFEYERESGVYNKAQISRMKESNKYYIPFQRDIEGEGVSVKLPRSRGFATRQTLKKMKGSDRQIVEPVMALIEAYMTRVAMADRNRAVGALLGSVEAGEVTGIKRIPDARPPMEYIDKKGKLHKIDWNEPLPDDFEARNLALAELSRGSKLGANEFVFIREGVPELWHVEDADIAKIIRGMPAMEHGPIGKVLMWFASLKRSGITQDPGYILRNVARDAQSGAALEKMGGLPFQNLIAGFWEVAGNTEKFKQFVREGGMGAALVEMDKNHLRTNVEKIFTDTGTTSAVANYVRHPLEAMRIIMERTDAMSRMGAWKRAGGGFKAAMGSRKLSLDFAERGTSAFVQKWASITPFLRPTILGMKQLGEALANRPLATGAKVMLYVMAPSVALYGLNMLYDQGLAEDDPQRWENTPRWVRDSFWLVPLPGGGEKLKIPKPPAIGPIASGLVERMLDWQVKNDKEAFTGYMDNFYKSFMPPLIPAAAEPIVEHVTNHSFFKGKPLIPASLEDASGYMQFTPYTSETAKALARVLGPMNADTLDISPIALDNYVRQWTGTLGRDVLRMFEAAVIKDVNTPWELADNPFVGSFFLRHDGAGELVDRFYEKAKEITAARRDFALAKGLDDEAMLDFTAENDKAHIRIEGIKNSLTMQRSAIQAIRADKDMTINDKRQMIDELTQGMVATARGGLETLEGLE